MIALLADMGRGLGGYSFVELVKWVIIICAIVAIAYVAFAAMGKKPPEWLIQMAIIVAVAFAAIVAIGFLASM